MGGSDQWGNIVMGVELGRRAGDFELYGITSPLVTTASGAKMGKTAQGAVWLTDDRLSAYDYWQFWRNTEDADVGRFLRLFTDLPLDEVERLERLQGSEINTAKQVLATEATALCHGRAAAEAAQETAHRVFAEGATGSALPTVSVPRGELERGIRVLELFVRAGLTTSNTVTRHLIRDGGAKLNDVVLTEEKRTISTTDLTTDGFIKLSAGRKRHALVKPG